MLSSLFVNATILVSFIFIAGQGLKNSPKALESPKGKLTAGIFGGVLGIILILYGIQVYGEIMIDLRFIPVVILAFYSTPISTIIAAFAIGVFRILYYGVNLSSVLGFAAIIIIALGCIVIARIKFKRILQFYTMFFYSLLVVDTALIILLSRSGKYMSIIIIYSVIYTSMAYIVYRLSEYILISNKLYIQFRDQARKDFLTGLNNVRQFDSILNGAFKRVGDSGEKLSILAIDIDHFKKINDTYGHDGGDVVLKQLGEILQSCCEQSDIAARVGGEEFSVILIDCDNSRAVEKAENIRERVNNYKFCLTSGNRINISISIGAATYPDSTDNIEELKKQADIELYKAKETGRNKVCSKFVKECHS